MESCETPQAQIGGGTSETHTSQYGLPESNRITGGGCGTQSANNDASIDSPMNQHATGGLFVLSQFSHFGSAGSWVAQGPINEAIAFGKPTR